MGSSGAASVPTWMLDQYDTIASQVAGASPSISPPDIIDDFVDELVRDYGQPEGAAAPPPAAAPAPARAAAPPGPAAPPNARVLGAQMGRAAALARIQQEEAAAAAALARIQQEEAAAAAAMDLVSDEEGAAAPGSAVGQKASLVQRAAEAAEAAARNNQSGVGAPAPAPASAERAPKRQAVPDRTEGSASSAMEVESETDGGARRVLPDLNLPPPMAGRRRRSHRKRL